MSQAKQTPSPSPDAFGAFAPDGAAYRITNPRTPAPWTNVVCNGRYGFVVSQRGGGFSWLDNSQLNVLTRWEMDLVRDTHGKFLYCADLDDHAIWSLAPAPCGDEVYERYACEHAPGSTRFETVGHGIEASWVMAVAEGDPVEVWHVTLTNRTDRRRRLRLSSYMEWCLGAAPDVKREFHTLFISTHYDAGRDAIFATKNMWDIPDRTEKDHWNRPWPYAAAHASFGDFERSFATADKAAFLGRYGSSAMPDGLIHKHGPTARFGRFSDACAALGGDMTLAPGETRTVGFLLAIDETPERVGALLDAYRSEGAAARAVTEAAQAWRARLNPVRVESSSFDFDALNNIWLPYQAISARLWGRTGYYQQSGAFGFRDQLQDSNVWLPREPERCREQILLHAAHQFKNGSVYHWWHPLVEFGLRTACSDDYLWLPFLTIRYLKDTGDRSILRARAPFIDDDGGAELIEHCERAIERAFERLSPRGLPLIGTCDWNDGLSACGADGRGESVWLAFFLAAILRDWARVLEDEGQSAGADTCRQRRAALVRAADEHAWDGAWYRRATDDNGRWIGAADCIAGRIYLNPQTWSILADAAGEERAATAWASVKAHLLREMGPLLLTPAYDTPDEDIGYITRYAPGGRENGGVYLHAAVWALAAACKRRDIEAVESIWKSISPPLRGRDAEGYRAEPYVMPGNADGPLSESPGKAGWTWYTGSAAWLHTVSLEWVAGIRPTWEGLLIDPVPMPSMGETRVQRMWRGRTVVVRFDAREARSGLRPTLELEGRPLDGMMLTEDHAPPGARVEIRVKWGGVDAGPLAEAEFKPGAAAPAGVERTTP